jgi:malonate decarboxylase beta subunit
VLGLLVAALFLDDVTAVRSAVIDAVGRGVPGRHRSQRIGELRARLETVDPADPPEPADLAAVWANAVPPRGDRP